MNRILASLKELCHLMPTGACADGKGAERDAAQDRAFALIAELERAEECKAGRRDVLDDYREECKADWQRTGEDN